MSTKKNLDALRKEIEPIVQQCQQSIANFKTDMFRHSQMIRRFDEVMCEKAQKTSIQEVYNELLKYIKKEEFESENQSMIENVESKLQEFDEMKEIINELNEKIKFEIQSAVRKSSKTETMKITQMVQNMIPKSSGNQDTDVLKKQIDQKADKFDLNQIGNYKSNKIDTENNSKAIDIMHKQMRHLVIMMMENFRVQLETENLSTQTKINRMNVVLQQSLLLAKWVSKFDPENINSYDLSLPKDLNDFQEYVTTSMDEIAFKNIPSYQNKKTLNNKIKRLATAHLERTPVNRTMVSNGSKLK